MREFWEGVQPEPWFRALPSKLRAAILKEPDRFAPLRVHGDDHPVKKSLSAVAVNFTSPLAWHITTLVSIFPIFILLLKHHTEDTVEALLDVMVWSFTCLFEGTMPMLDSDNNSFKKGSFSWKNRGRSIAGGIRFIVCEVAGDWKWLRKVFMMTTSYCHNSICHLCFASKLLSAGDSFADFRACARHRSRRRSHADFVANIFRLRRRIPVLTKLPHFHVSMIVFDWMHAFLLGVAQFVCGNAIVQHMENRRFGHFRGAARVAQTLMLRIAWARFNKFCAQHAVNHSQPMFTTGSVGLNESGPKWPLLKAKAGNTGCVLRWLDSVERGIAGATEHICLRRNVVCSLNHAHQLLLRSNMFFADGSEKEFHDHISLALLSYEILSREAAEMRLPRWQLKPKHHAIDEMASASLRTKRNPRSQWCMKGEDFMGVSSRLSSRSHPSTVSFDALERWLLNLRFPAFE